MSEIINNLKELKEKVHVEGENSGENPVQAPEQKLSLVDRAYVSYTENRAKALERKAAKQAAKAEKKAAKDAKKAEKKPTKHLGAKIAAGVVLGGALIGGVAKVAMSAHANGEQTCDCEDADQDYEEDNVPDAPSDDVPNEE